MVLNEATESFDNFSSADNAPNSDDPNSPADYRRGYIYNPSQYASVMPFAGAIMGFSPEKRKIFNDNVLAKVSELAERRLTDAEVDTISRMQYIGTSIISWGNGIGIMAGVARAYQLQKTGVTVPGINLTKRFGASYDKFLGLRGQTARLVWYPLRYALYAQFCMYLGRWVAASYAASHTIVQFRLNPELKDLSNVFEKGFERSKIAREQQRRAQGMTADQAAQGAAQSMRGPQHVPQGNTGNDADHSADTGILTDAQRTQLERQAENNSRREAQRSPQYPYPTPQRPQQTTSSFDEDSPTGGAGLLDDYSSSPSSSSSSGSAWDRIRQQSSQPSQSSSAPPARSFPSAQQQTSPERQYGRQPQQQPEDSFSFSNTDEERQLAKVEAQKAFDERVDRERRGEDFNSGARRW